MFVRPRRPPVLDAARTALIPLRPLTVTEILDGGFLIVSRNVRLMLGLPLVVAGGAAAYVLLGVGMWVLLGNSTSRTAQIVLAVLMGLAGVLVLQQFLVWMTAILSRVSLQTVLGEGFAPVAAKATWRTSWPMFWPVLGLSVLQGLAVSAVQTILSFGYYAAIAGFALVGADSEGTVQVVMIMVLTVVAYLAMVVAYGFLSLTVPALATEARNAPGWIGKPFRPTTVISSFERSIKLVGRRHIVRVGLLYGGLVLICVGLLSLLMAGLGAIVALFAQAIAVDVADLVDNRWVILGVVLTSVLLAMSALLAYVAAVQTLLYLDLRMRREALDLTMRFDCMPVPQVG